LRVTASQFRGDIWHQKNSPWAIVWLCLRDPRCSHSSRTPTYDGRTHDDSIYRASLA